MIFIYKNHIAKINLARLQEEEKIILDMIKTRRKEI